MIENTKSRVWRLGIPTVLSTHRHPCHTLFRLYRKPIRYSEMRAKRRPCACAHILYIYSIFCACVCVIHAIGLVCRRGRSLEWYTDTPYCCVSIHMPMRMYEYLSVSLCINVHCGYIWSYMIYDI